jgi:hypothetical protein
MGQANVQERTTISGRCKSRHTSDSPHPPTRATAHEAIKFKCQRGKSLAVTDHAWAHADDSDCTTSPDYSW